MRRDRTAKKSSNPRGLVCVCVSDSVPRDLHTCSLPVNKDIVLFLDKNTDGEENSESMNVIFILQICSHNLWVKTYVPNWWFFLLKERISCCHCFFSPFSRSEFTLRVLREEQLPTPLFFQFSLLQKAHLPTSTVYQQGSLLLSRCLLTKDRSCLGKKASCLPFMSDNKPAWRPERLRRWKDEKTEGAGFLFRNRLLQNSSPGELV